MSVNITLLEMYNILMIFVEIFHDIGWYFATRIRIRLTKMKRIRIRNTVYHNQCFLYTILQNNDSSVISQFGLFTMYNFAARNSGELRCAAHCFPIEKAGRQDFMHMIIWPLINKDINSRKTMRGTRFMQYSVFHIKCRTWTLKLLSF